MKHRAHLRMPRASFLPAAFLSLLPLLQSSLLQAQQSPITRDGRYWVTTISGSGTVAQPRVLVRTNGDVTVHGTSQKTYTYTLKLRVRASNEAEARRRLAAIRVTATPSGETLVLATPLNDVSSDWRLDVPAGVKEVAVASRGGGVEALEFPGSIHAETGGGGVHCDKVGGNVDVQTGGGGIAIGSVDGSVHCTTGGGGISANLIHGGGVFSSGGGDVVIQQVDGVLDVSTAGGGIKVVRAGAAVLASTAGGPIQIDHAGGKVTAKSSAGPIRVDSASGVRCESAAGGIRLGHISGSVYASTAVGSIIAALLANRQFADSFLTTGSGDITVLIPSNLALTIHAENQAADSLRRIVSDFPGIAVRLQGSAAVAEGPINGGGPILRIKGTNGTIYLKKQ